MLIFLTIKNGNGFNVIGISAAPIEYQGEYPFISVALASSVFKGLSIEKESSVAMTEMAIKEKDTQ